MDRVEKALLLFPKVRCVGYSKQENRPWHTEWRDAFPPLPVGRKWIVLAPWHKGTEPAGRIPLILYPGAAFGTGYHESTQIALTLLEQCVKPGMTAADIGAGSGVLAIASLTLGAGVVYARDLDPAVLDEVKRNFGLNDLSLNRLDLAVGDLLKGFAPKVEILTANILFGPLCEMLPSVPETLKKGGSAIFAGLLVKEREIFLQRAEEAGLKPVSEHTANEWWGAAFTPLRDGEGQR
jgi:ribosomal protein L11 methyltransferase